MIAIAAIHREVMRHVQSARGYEARAERERTGGVLLPVTLS